MKLPTKRVMLSLAGLLLTAGNSLAATAYEDPISHLGFMSDILKEFVGYLFWGAIIVAFCAALVLHIKGNAARSKGNSTAALDARKGTQDLIIDSVLLVISILFLYSWVVPKLSAILGVA